MLYTDIDDFSSSPPRPSPAEGSDDEFFSTNESSDDAMFTPTNDRECTFQREHADTEAAGLHREACEAKYTPKLQAILRESRLKNEAHLKELRELPAEIESLDVKIRGRGSSWCVFSRVVSYLIP